MSDLKEPNSDSATTNSLFQSAQDSASDDFDKKDALIPDRVLFRDCFSDEWGFSDSVHYLFEGEDIPASIPKESSIFAEIGDQTDEIKSLSSFSPHFLAYDATFVSPSSFDKEQIIPELAYSKTLSTLVISGAYSNSLSTKQHKLKLLSDVKEGKITISEATDRLNSCFSHRNQTLRSVLDLEASDYQKISTTVGE